MTNQQVPNFRHTHQDLYTYDRICNTEWQVIGEDYYCRLVVKNSGITLRYGNKDDRPFFQAWADTHNTNLLMGISDESYNRLILEVQL